ncbi:uncharacterized protein LOC112046898 [Bicyclus anynana]|uniref:Uncharacterized protein LOC112046898 n=1 Tax=Bicyclus anynana TaxID=110368 RepID=A0A6J1N304_BICAN|nr:uncharacterized protein LOC112046898 [Bicyclus anynana]
MQRITLLVFAAIVAMALAEGQYYVPRSYYIIDAEGHASAPIPLRRLRRSVGPYPLPYAGGASANANANAEAQSWGGSANANANAQAISRGGAGGWELPAWNYGSGNPNTLSAGEHRRQSGSVVGGRSISTGSSVGIDSSGKGYYDQYTSVSN